MNKSRFHLTKRDNISTAKKMMIRAAGILLALIICGIFIVAVTGQNPVQVYISLVDGAIGRARRIRTTVREAAFLLIIAVGLTPAFRMRFWNIGAEGQILMGALVSAALMIYGKTLQNAILIPLIFICGLAAGMIWGLIPAFFKAKTNTNETLFTLMLNYVAMQFVTCCIILWESPKGSNKVGILNSDSHAGWLPSFFGGSEFLIAVFAVIVTVVTMIYMNRTKHGYEVAVVGESRETARYIGVDAKKVIIRTMMISGAICGLAGAIIVTGSGHTISISTANGRGFTAIIVAWMSHFNPWAMAFVSFLLAFMQTGAIQIATDYGLNADASGMITGIILFCLIGCEFFINYRIERAGKEEMS